MTPQQERDESVDFFRGPLNALALCALLYVILAVLVLA